MKALQGHFKEATEKNLRLPGCDSEVFKVFLYWMWRNEAPAFAQEVDALDNPTPRQVAVDNREMLLIRAWMFGDGYLIPKFQNEVMDSLLYFLELYPTSWSVIHYASELAPKTSLAWKAVSIQARFLYFGDGEDCEMNSEGAEHFAKIKEFIKSLGPVKEDYLQRDGSLPDQLERRKKLERQLMMDEVD